MRTVPSKFNRNRKDPCKCCDINDICTTRACGRKSVHRFLDPDYYWGLKLDRCNEIMGALCYYSFIAGFVLNLWLN